MSLIKCTVCGKEVGDETSACPNCGCPVAPNGDETLQINNNSKKHKLKVISIVTALSVLIIIGFISIFLVFNNSKNDIKDLILNYNEEGIIDDWKIIITDIEILDTISMNEYFTFNSDDGNKYLKINCTVTNIGTKPKDFLPFLAIGDEITVKLLYQGDYEFNSSDLIGYRDDLHDVTLSPLSAETGCIAFDIPDSVAKSAEELILVFSSGNKNIKYKIR